MNFSDPLYLYSPMSIAYIRVKTNKKRYRCCAYSSLHRFATSNMAEQYTDVNQNTKYETKI